LNIPRQLIKQNNNKIVIKLSFDPVKKNKLFAMKPGQWESATAYCGDNKLDQVKYIECATAQKGVPSAV